jgi:tRNA threonylcarbamoyladenosine biosynthesis protein TsaB
MRMRNDLFLVIEASTSHASVALVNETEVVASVDVSTHDPQSGLRTEGVAPSIDRMFGETQLTPAQLTGIICGAGPGGFTSLRSAAAIAKGMCFALTVPLYQVSTPELMVAEAQLPSGAYLTAIDAGRGEFYATLVHVVDTEITQLGAVSIVTHEALVRSANEANATILTTQRDHAAWPRARAALPLLNRIRTAGPVDLDRWEPTYGRLAEAQVKWEAAHGRPLSV